MDFVLQAEARQLSGRSSNRRLRRLGKVPAVVYGGNREALSVALDYAELQRQMNQPAFYTSIVSVKVGNDSHAAVVKEVQRHPAKPYVLHLDFQRIIEDEELSLHVPLRFLGEETAKGVKEQGGVVEHLATDLEISCLPRNLPEFIEVDVSPMELNETLHLSDLKLPAGISLVALEQGQDLPVVTITQPRRVRAEEGEEGEEGAESGE